MKSLILRFAALALVLVSSAVAQTLGYSGTPALLNNVTLSMHGTANQPYVLAASDSPGPTVVAPLGSFDLGYPPIIIAGAIPGLPVVPALDASGNMSMTFNIPFNTSLIGTTWWFQAVYFDPLSPYGISMTNGTHFTIADPFLAPTITSIAPSSGPAAGGTQVAIMGTNFLPGGTTVTVGSSPLLNLTVATPTLILGTIPPGTPGYSANVTVTTLVGGASVLAGGFTYLGSSAPSIASISPTHAPISGGGIFTLTGQGLGAGTTVYLNGVACIALSQSPTSYAGIIPNTSTPGYATLVAVSTAGVGTLSGIFRYTIVLDVGNGSDGAFAPTSNVLIDTTVNGGVFNYTSFTIPAGVTVTARGPNPLVIKCLGDVTIDGVLDLKGGDGIVAIFLSTHAPTSGFNWEPMVSSILAASLQFPIPGAGGAFGGRVTSIQSTIHWLLGNGTSGIPGIQGEGPGAVPLIANQAAFSVNWGVYFGVLTASHGSTLFTPYPAVPPATYGTSDLTPLTAGSGGASILRPGPGSIGGGYSEFEAGAAGGGAVEIRTAATVDVQGLIDARGGTRPFSSVWPNNNICSASGGGIKVSAIGSVHIGPSAGLVGGGYGSNSGRWAIRSWDGTLSYGTSSVISAGLYGSF